MLGQYEVAFAKKNLTTHIIEHALLNDTNIAALEIKDVVLKAMVNGSKDKEVTLVLPQESFEFAKIDIPKTIDSASLLNFIKTKVATDFKINLNASNFDYQIIENEGVKKAIFYAITHECLNSYKKALALCGLEIVSVIPDTVTYFKLFQKTLRQNKNEVIWYVRYENERVSSYLYDSFSLIPNTFWTEAMTPERIFEKVLHKKSADYINPKFKINRLIVTGKSTENIRQDTFTKSVGIWTNPLKKIINHFYSDYIKILTPQNSSTEIPVISFDMVIGAFIFSQENKSFSLLKQTPSSKNIEKQPLQFKLPVMTNLKINKSVLIFLFSALVTYGVLYGIYLFFPKNMNFLSINNLSGISDIFKNQVSTAPSKKSAVTPTPIPTFTPTPTPNRSVVRIQILNGSGVKGKATVVKNFLKEKGYENILTGNAKNFNYEKTVIQTKKDGVEIRKTLANDIASEILENPEYENLSEDSASDVVLIFGQDFR